MKKFIILLLTMCLSVNVGVIISSAESLQSNPQAEEEVVYDLWDCLTEVTHYSTLEEAYASIGVASSGFSLQGASKPSENWDLSKQYDFSGSTHSQTCYLNYWIINHNSDCYFTVKETSGGGTYQIKIIVYGWLWDSTVYTYTCDQGKSYSAYFGNAIDEDDKFTMAFIPTTDYISFNGTVKRA